MSKNNIFCGGVLCRKSDRRYKCITCNKYVCGICSIPEGKKIYCINCYLKTFSPNWDRLNKEFEEMITKLNIKKTENPEIIIEKEIV